MSTSRYYLLCIFLADLAGIVLSYCYGAIVPAWMSSWLPARLGFLRTAALWLYQLPLAPLPHVWHAIFLQQPGLYWLGGTLLYHLWLWLLYLLRRNPAETLGEPYPGGPYWETVQGHFKNYREAMQRWKPKWALKTPTWRYYKRQDSSQPDLFWHGRILIIECTMFAPDRREELATALARELMYYNSDDIWVKDLLSFYLSGGKWLLFFSGFCILLPALFLIKFLWSDHWEKRTLAADRFVYLVGQGLLLFQQVLLRLRQEDQLPDERRTAAQEIEEATHKRDALQQHITTYKAQLVRKHIEERQYARSDSLNAYQHSSSLFQVQGQPLQAEVVPEDETLRLLRQQRNQLNQEITALHERKLQLALQEQQSFLIRPMLEQRLEQLAALLNNERHWMQQHHLPLPSQYQQIASFSAPDAARRETQQIAP